MKKCTFSVLSFLFLFSYSFAQLHSIVKANFAAGSNDLFTFSKMVGGSNKYGKGFKTVGFTFSKPFKNWLYLETGLIYAQYKVEQTPGFMPGMDMTPKAGRIDLLTIPATLHIDFLRFFFIHTGIALDMQLRNNIVNDQTGLGISAGLGVKYDFRVPISVFVNPYALVHSLVGISFEQNPYKLIESGWRFGIGYRI